jgi:hypothetical protein
MPHDAAADDDDVTMMTMMLCCCRASAHFACSMKLQWTEFLQRNAAQMWRHVHLNKGQGKPAWNAQLMKYETVFTTLPLEI